MTTKTTREAKSRLEKFYDERVISFGGKGKKFWVKLYEKDLEHLLEKEKETLLERVEGIMKESIGIEKLKDPTDLKKRIQRFAYRCVKNYQKHQRQALSIIREEKTK